MYVAELQTNTACSTNTPPFPPKPALLTVQLPLLLIISGRLGSHKWARLGHYIHSVRRS